MSGFKVVLGLSVFALALTLSSQSSFAEQNPTARTNILWISIDDQSPWYGTYGDTRVQTPNIDALASQGVVFERAYAPSPVCSPTRSAIIIVVALVLARMQSGNTDTSTTRRFSRPLTRQYWSTTAIGSESGPILQVPEIC